MNEQKKSEALGILFARISGILSGSESTFGNIDNIVDENDVMRNTCTTRKAK
jgi:hypothetical protein